MIVRVNDCRIRIFRGATVGDALLRYSVRNGLDLSAVRSIKVADRWGHELDHAAPLTEIRRTASALFNIAQGERRESSLSIPSHSNVSEANR